MPNFDGKVELRLFYSTIPTDLPVVEHRLTFDIAFNGTPEPGTPFSEMGAIMRDGGTADLTTWLADLMLLLVEFYPATTSFSRWEMWRAEEGSHDFIFISSLPIGEVGSNASASTPAGQVTFTFRSIGGGVARFQLMESSVSGNFRLSPPYSDIADDLTDFLIDGGTIMLARDNSYVFSNIAQNNGQNEALWRKRYR